jgi:hypothetical protein
MEPKGSLSCTQEPSTGPYPEPYQSNPHHPILRLILIWSTHLSLGLPSHLFSFGFPTNISHVFIISPTRATYPDHLIFLDFILIIPGEEYKSLIGPNIHISTLFSNTLSLCSSHNGQSPRFTPIQNHRQIYSFVYSNNTFSIAGKNIKGPAH